MAVQIDKYCPACKQTLPAPSFHKNCLTSTGLDCYCKSCKQLKAVARYNYKVSVSEKRCSSCKFIHSADAFGKNRRSPSGLASRCKNCTKMFNAIYYENNGDEMRAWASAYAPVWRAQNPEQARYKIRNYQHRKRSQGGGVLREEWLQLLKKYCNQCLRCGTMERIEMDHIVPLSKGGKHEIANIQPLCRYCNATKGAKTIDYRGVLSLC